MSNTNIQNLISNGLLTSVANIDPNNTYVEIGVHQPGTRKKGSAENSYKSFALTLSELLVTSAVYTASSGISLVGTDFQLASNLVSQFTNDSGYLTSASITGMLIGSGTLNYLPKFTPDGTTLGDSQIFDDGTNVGIGTATPSAKLSVYNNANNYANLGGSQTIIRESANQFLQFSYNNPGDVYLSATDILLTSPTGGKTFVIHSGGTVGTLFSYNVSDYLFKSTAIGNINSFEINHFGYNGNNRLGVNVTPTATAHFKGVDSTIANFALKVDNSNNSSVFHVRNDGCVGVGGTSIWSNYALQIIPTNTSKGLQIIGNSVGSVVLGTSSDNSSGELRLYSLPQGSQTIVLNAIGDSYIVNNNFGVGTATPTSKLQVVGLPTYANNAAALAASLTIGAFYHTAGALKVVF